MRRLMALVFTLSLIVTFIGGCVTGSVEVDRQERWETLFDGETLNGWTQRGGEAHYHVEDGAIVGTAVPGTHNSFLCTEEEFGDFILELEFKVDPELNSGVQIRSQSYPAYKNGRVHGYQVEIDPSDRAWSGGIYDEGRRGWLHDLKGNLAARAAFRADDWNHLRIEAIGDSIRTWINGVMAADLVDSMTPSGFIALQVHATSLKRKPQVRWRNIRIQNLDEPDDTAYASDPFMGDWATSEVEKPRRLVAKVVALGNREYRATLFREFDTQDPSIATLFGREKEGALRMQSVSWEGKIEDDKFSVQRGTRKRSRLEMNKVVRLSPTLATEPPAGATILFDGSDFDEWEHEDGRPVRWNIVNNAMEIVPGSGSLKTKTKFTNIKLHVEFRTPFLPDARSQDRGNSGVYLHERYEIQILDGYGFPNSVYQCGSIYQVAAPLITVCSPPTQWQTYDIVFQPPRFDENSSKLRDARVTVVHNGVTIHDDFEVSGPTGSAASKGESPGPAAIILEDHGNRVQYRNIWVIELDALMDPELTDLYL